MFLGLLRTFRTKAELSVKNKCWSKLHFSALLSLETLNKFRNQTPADVFVFHQHCFIAFFYSPQSEMWKPAIKQIYVQTHALTDTHRPHTLTHARLTTLITLCRPLVLMVIRVILAFRFQENGQGEHPTTNLTKLNNLGLCLLGLLE